MPSSSAMAALQRLDTYAGRAKANTDLFEYARGALRLVRSGPLRLRELEEVARQYSAAVRGEGDVAAVLSGCAAKVGRWSRTWKHRRGVPAGDRAAGRGRVGPEAARRAPGRARRAGPPPGRARRRPPQRREVPLAGARDAGAGDGPRHPRGNWEPPGFKSEDVVEVRYDLPSGVWKGGPFRVEWYYTSGAHALRIDATRLLQATRWSPRTATPGSPARATRAMSTRSRRPRSTGGEVQHRGLVHPWVAPTAPARCGC